MPFINRTKRCNVHGIYRNSNTCPLCITRNQKHYDKHMRSKDRKKIYNTKRWKDIRIKAMVRDNFLCQHCLKDGKEVRGQEMDHQIELMDDISLAYDINNLVYLCRTCHRIKTEKERKKRQLKYS